MLEVFSNISRTARIFDNVKIGNGSIICHNAFLQKGVTIGQNTIIGPNVVIESNARIGDNVTIQPFSIIARDMIVGNNVFIGPHFSCADVRKMYDGEHGNSPNKETVEQFPPCIMKNTRIGTRVTLAPGVTIGPHCHIGMESKIYRSIDSYEHITANSIVR